MSVKQPKTILLFRIKMKSSTYTLSYIFVTNVFIIIYGLVATSGFTLKEVMFQKCAEEFVAIVLTYVACIIVVLMVCISCIFRFCRYTLDDMSHNSAQQHSTRTSSTYIVYHTPPNLRKGFLILCIVVVNIWNCVVTINTSTEHHFCVQQYRNTQKSMIILSHLMAGNAVIIACIFAILFLNKYRQRII